MNSSIPGHRKPLVTVVGWFSDERVELARRLLDEGIAVSLCAGPPACSLLRGEPCALLETADATVLLPSGLQDPKIVAGLSLCAESAPRCMVLEPSTVVARGTPVHARFADMSRVASFVMSMLHHPSIG